MPANGWRKQMPDEKIVRVGSLNIKVRDKPRTQAEHEAAETRARKKGVDFELLPDDAHRIRKRRNITLSPRALAIAKKLADGNVSRGIERALFHFHDCPRTDGRRKKEEK
jgi:hypothetical protein